MGLDIKRLTEKNVPLNFTKEEINHYMYRFKSLDVENKGYISINDLRRYFKVSYIDKILHLFIVRREIK